jgi:hypothetical protein
VDTSVKNCENLTFKEEPNICLGCTKNGVIFSAGSYKKRQMLTHKKKHHNPTDTL